MVVQRCARMCASGAAVCGAAAHRAAVVSGVQGSSSSNYYPVTVVYSNTVLILLATIFAWLDVCLKQLDHHLGLTFFLMINFEGWVKHENVQKSENKCKKGYRPSLKKKKSLEKVHIKLCKLLLETLLKPT